MKIDGSKLLIYLDGEPIGCTTPATINVTPQDEITSICDPRSEFILNLEGVYKFGELEMTYLQKIVYNWHRAKEMPRKRKKAYRKRLEKAYAEEQYRQQVINWLDSI